MKPDVTYASIAHRRLSFDTFELFIPFHTSGIGWILHTTPQGGTLPPPAADAFRERVGPKQTQCPLTACHAQCMKSWAWGGRKDHHKMAWATPALGDGEAEDDVLTTAVQWIGNAWKSCCTKPFPNKPMALHR